MAQYGLQRAAAGRIGRTGIVGTALALALAGFTGSAWAQEKEKKKEKAPAAAPAAKGAPADGSQSAWVKLCEKANVVGKDKDGKEEKKEFNICLTHHERLDGNTGMVLVSAAVRQVEGQDKQHFMIMVPLGMMIQPGMRAAVYTKDLWDKVQKNEKIDESKLKPIRLTYTLCHPGGCTAELEATPELITDMKAGGGIMVLAINAGGQPVAFPVPLNGFDTSFAGPPIDNQKYTEARRQLMQQIAQRQQAQMEEYKKQNDELQKMQGSEALKGTAAKAAPAKKEKDK
jgi:invasion protein IalB